MTKQLARSLEICFAALVLLIAAVFVAPQHSFAGTLNTSVIGMFPKTVGEFGYADLKAARQFAWYPQLREQLLPSKFRQFEQFLTSAGVDPNAQVDELAWGAINSKANGEQVVGVALGSFDPSSSETRFKQAKLPMIEEQGYHLYAFGSGSGPGDILFTFIDSNTAAFGHRKALEQLIDVRMGGTESLLTNDQIFPLISEANGSGVVWGVFDKEYSHIVMQQLIPQASQFPQAAAMINRIKAMMFTAKADSGVEADFQAQCASPDDANLLSAAIQAGLMYRRYQESQSQPDLAGALDRVQVSSVGDRLKVDAPVSQDQLMGLIRSKALAVTM